MGSASDDELGSASDDELGLYDVDDFALSPENEPSMGDNAASPVHDEPRNSSLHDEGEHDSPEEIGSEREETEVEATELEKCIMELENGLAVGKKVADFEQAFILYCEYGRMKGFSVRRGMVRNVGRSDVIKWKEYLCSAAGKTEMKGSSSRLPAYKKLIRRTGCKAKIRIHRSEGGGSHVSHFIIDHNHPFVPVEQSYLLRSNRHLSHAQGFLLESLTSAGIGVSRACEFMEKQCGGPNNLGFTVRDAYDHRKRVNRVTKFDNGDATAVMEYLFAKANKQPHYFWKVQTDDYGRIMNIFYRDERCLQDFESFGDVLSVDTTYRTNKYNLVCAPFIGINHHGWNVMFGMAFLSDETTSTFEWLFRTFLESMFGAEPKIIFTDQCAAMMRAIDVVFPNSKHRLCQWHINKNAHSHFGKLNSDTDFKELWYRCMNRVDDEAEFESVWNEMIQSYDLRDNSWFSSMYNLRHRWASVFSNDTFCAGLHATSRSEATNRVLKDLQRGSASLFDFVCNLENITDRWRKKEIEQDTLSMWVPGQLIDHNELLSDAAVLYTPNVYKEFEGQFTLSLNVVLKGERVQVGEDTLELCATTALGKRLRKVIFNLKTHHATCSCRKWETDGILCRHILKVYLEYNVFAIPQSLILSRWRRRVNGGFVKTEDGLDPRPSGPYVYFCDNVVRKVYEMAGCAIHNDSVRKMITERIEDLREEVFDMVGKPEAKMRKKRSKDISSKVCSDLFCDPERIYEKRYVASQKKRGSNVAAEGNRPTRKTPKKALKKTPQKVEAKVKLPFYTGTPLDVSSSAPT